MLVLQYDPRKPHLTGIHDKGLIFIPTGEIRNFGCYVNADFVGNYTKEHCEGHNTVKLRTKFSITYTCYPITWFSALQSKISLSTSKVEYI